MPDIAPVTTPVCLFDHNWLDNAVAESSWTTQIDQFVSADEQRRGQTGKPRRMLTLSGITFSRGDAGAFLNQLRLGSQGRYYQPFAPDETILDAAAAAGATVLSCDTADRRFFAGFHVLVVVWVNAKASVIVEGTIAAVTASSLTLAAPLPSDLPRGASVYPAIETEVVLRQEASIATDRHLTFTANFLERPGSPGLPALSTPGVNPSGEPTYRSLPILSIPHNQDRNTVGRSRRSEQVEVGLDTIIQIYGTTAFLTGSLSFLQLTRAEAFRVLRFFDSRGGSTHPFWYANRTADIGLTEKVSNTIFRVEKTIPAADLLAVKFLAFWTESTVAVRRISSVVETTNYHQVTVDEAVTFTQAEIVRVSWACMARFNTDTIRETWQSKQAMSTELAVIGLTESSNALCVGEGCEGGGVDLPDPVNPRTDDPDEPEWEPETACEASSIDIPMYFDCTEARGSGREAIRAADLTMPERIKISVKRGLVRDTNHPHTSDLSDELDALLYRDHFLDAVGDIPRTTSKNPYHIRVTGVSPATAYTLPPGAVAVDPSPYWQKSIEYTVGSTVHTLYLRCYVEWATAANGAWGSLLCVIAWSTEIMPTYVDGVAFAPFHGIPFVLTDPLVSGSYHGRPIDEKWFHPKLLFAALVPTTWHSPVGYEWFTPDREARLAECYRVLNGAPWSTGTPEDALSNSVFGTSIGSHDKGAMTLGGWTVSEPFEWLCIENAAGLGRTFLKPTNPGWDEAIGELTMMNDLTFEVCSPPQSPIDGCSGHPLDPLDGIGGTHACFRNSPTVPDPDLVKYLCAPAGRKSAAEVDAVAGSVSVTEQCITTTATYDGDCVVVSSSCSSASRTTSLTAPFYDMNLSQGGNPLNRLYVCKGFYPNPDYVLFNWVWEDVPTIYDQWSAAIGGWSFGDDGADRSQVTNTSLAGNSNATGYAEYDPISVEPTQQFDDGSITADLVASSVPKGLAVRSDKDGLGRLYRGYTAVEDRSGGLVRLWRIDSGTSRTLLGSAAINASGNIRLSLRAFGSEIKASWADNEIVVHDCTYLEGINCGLVVEGAASGAVFNDIEIEDLNFRCLECEVRINGGADDISGSMDPKLGRAYAADNCDENTPEGCTGEFPDGCSCTSTHKQISATYSGSSLNYPSGDTAPAESDWHPPTDVGTCDQDPCPPSPGPACSDCPPAHLAFSARLPGNCSDPENPTGSLFIHGLDVWYWSPVTCA